MDEETNINTADAASEVPVATPAKKKTRQSRKTKTAAEATTSVDAITTEEPAKKTRAKREPKAVPAKAPTASRSRGSDKKAAAAPAKPVSSAAEPTDEFADLLKLEEENKSLRKQLSEKLRAENADLRKRLGQA